MDMTPALSVFAPIIITLNLMPADGAMDAEHRRLPRRLLYCGKSAVPPVGSVLIVR
jgi:hypothetical protein